MTTLVLSVCAGWEQILGKMRRKRRKEWERKEEMLIVKCERWRKKNMYGKFNFFNKNKNHESISIPVKCLEKPIF